jgi:oligoribonuclease NrnB/cAMP/cGMP phosphodiesterase (DHH superfamily)
MEYVIISHAADFDGIVSAALIMRRYGISSDNVIFVDYGRDSVELGEKRFKKLFRTGATLFITDLSAESTPDVFMRILSHAKAMRGKVFWFDHHPWSAKNIRAIASRCNVAVVGENKRFCASEITAKELGLKDPFTNSLLKLVHISDFALTPKSSNMKSVIGGYVLGLSYYRMKGDAVYKKMLARITESICNEDIFPPFLKQAASRFTSLNKKRLKKMIQTVIKGGIVSVAFTPIVSTNDACNLIIKETGSDIGCYINTDSGKAHFRSIKNDCSLLAGKFGGGGHPHASGFDFSTKKYNMRTKKGRSKLAKEIISVAAAIY